MEDAETATVLTVGHGTLPAAGLAALLTGADVALLIDVRTAPGSRRQPHVARAELERWVPEAGIAYRWAPELGGFRRPSPDSPNVALRHPSFRGYADYMRGPEFGAGLSRLAAEARQTRVALMCAETVWWRCHRRLVADALELRCGLVVRHLGHDARLSPHRRTEGVRVDENGLLVYDAGESPLPLPG